MVEYSARYSIFYRHSYCRGTRCLIFLSELMGPALSDLSLLLSRRLRTFGLYGYVAASFCREGSSRIAGRIYSIIFLLKYIKQPVFQNNSILYFVFFVKLHFWCVCMFLLKWPQYFIFPFRPVKVRLMLFKDVIWTCREAHVQVQGLTPSCTIAT